MVVVASERQARRNGLGASTRFVLRGEPFHNGRLLGRRHVPLLSAEGPWPAHWLRRSANHAAEPHVLPFSDALGLVRRPLWPANDADDYLSADHSGRATLSADHRLHDDRGVLHPARLLWRRRHAHA